MRNTVQDTERNAVQETARNVVQDAEKGAVQDIDARLATQPIGYWTGVAYNAVIAYLRAEMARLGATQPQYWVLRYLSVNDVSEDGAGLTVEELTERMRAFLRPEDDLAVAAEDLLARGLLTRDAERRLWITDAGEAMRQEIKRHVPRLRDRVHEGVDDADYVTALKVLERVIKNVGGEIAW
ncbi:MarR family winged helix-turn-helix transcriptional regulator [Streptomyces sp. URMC 123]|uniref:MarR family winged helix-turn-helix transcriptional regulator n=1 Tax=Streptomyces sp. URMC 123 TaxID=3423403 RepID=UPI003F19474F